MKLIVDSGSTKADWIAIDTNGKVLFTANTLGLNPEVLNKEEILKRINAQSQIADNKLNATHLHFYGAGCGTQRMIDFLTNVFEEYFSNAIISVKEDTYAAVFATTAKNEKAIVCILGTGSNCSYFDGTILHQKVQSLGYIAMDDCSGNRFGRHLIRYYYFNQMPNELASKFEEKYNLEADVIKHNFYKEPNPNAYLASFAGFLIENKQTDFCQKIIREEIEKFVQFYIKQFDDYKQVPVNFVGSIAFLLKEELETILAEHQIKIGNVCQKPIDGLIQYHAVND